MKNPEVVILGHSGFIGREIFEQSSKSTTRGISSTEVDLREPESIDYLNRELTANNILIFSAALIRQKGDNLETLQDNIRLATNIASVIENHPIKKLVYLSTADVYGQPDSLPITEKTPINPQTYYAAAKYCSESLLRVACQKASIPMLTFRYSGIFGPGQKHPQYGPNSFIESALNDGVIKIWGDGEELRDMVYVKDLARIIVQLSKSETRGTFNIATGKTTTFLEVAQMLCQFLPRHIAITHQERSGPKFNQEFNIDKLRQTLPEFNFTPLSQALLEMYASFQHNP